LQGLAAQSSPVDILVVALVGHVVEDSGRATFWPVGANLVNQGTLVFLDEVLEALATAPAQKKLLMLDCWRKDWKSAAKLARVRVWDRTPAPGVAILYACGRGETGYEHPSSWHGAFNHFLIQGLLGEAAQPQITGPTLSAYCKRQLSKMGTAAGPGADQDPVWTTGVTNEPWAITAPGDTAALYLQGCRLLEKKAYDGAIEAFNQAEKKLPGFVELYLQRADAYHEKAENKRAMADCRRAIELERGNAAAYAYMAQIEADTKEFTSAVKNATKAIDLDPQCAPAYDARAYVHLRRMQWDDALADLDMAIELNEKLAFLYAHRGYVWSQKKDLKRAINDYTGAISRDGSNPKWWNERGVLRTRLAKAERKLSDLDSAILDLQEATKLDSLFRDAYRNLGNAYYDKAGYSLAEKAPVRAKAEYALAEKALLRAVEIDPDFARAHRDLSSVYLKLNNKKEAERHKEIADRLGK
jgi:tetratricopeptide (TPR) repeat protein